MNSTYVTQSGLVRDLRAMGLAAGDGVFVHASLRAIGRVVGGPRSVIAAFGQVVGPDGLIGMPGFSTDAYFPPNLVRKDHNEAEIDEIEAAVPGFDPATSSAVQNGAIAIGSDSENRWAPIRTKENFPSPSLE